MKLFTNLSQKHRQNNKSAPPVFTALEEKLKQAFSITDDTLNKAPDKVLLNLNKPGNQTTFSGEDVHKAIDASLEKNLKSKSKQSFKKGCQYTTEDIRSRIKLSKLQTELKYPGENDFMAILSNMKLFMSIEVKCNMKENKNQSSKGPESEEDDATNSPQQTSRPNIDGNLKKAAAQLRKNSEYTSRLHGSILHKGWRFIKIAAILPRPIEEDAICLHCRKFILTEDIITKPGGMEEWWVKTGIIEKIVKMDQQATQQGYEDFLILFNRLVNLSCIHTKVQKVGIPNSWAQIQGDNPRYISSGYTSTPKGSKSVELDFEEVLCRPHDAFKCLFFNQDQYKLLTTNDLFRVVFLCDYGAGKA